MAKVLPLSGVTKGGVFRLARYVYEHVEAGKNSVYVIGQTNIGKSTLALALADTFYRHVFYTGACGDETKVVRPHELLQIE